MLAASFQCTALHVHMRDWYCSNPSAMLRAESQHQLQLQQLAVAAAAGSMIDCVLGEKLGIRQATCHSIIKPRAIGAPSQARAQAPPAPRNCDGKPVHAVIPAALRAVAKQSAWRRRRLRDSPGTAAAQTSPRPLPSLQPRCLRLRRNRCWVLHTWKRGPCSALAAGMPAAWTRRPPRPQLRCTRWRRGDHRTWMCTCCRSSNVRYCSTIWQSCCVATTTLLHQLHV